MDDPVRNHVETACRNQSPSVETTCALSKPNASVPKPVETQCDCRNLVETTMRQVITTLSKRPRSFLSSPPPFPGEYGGRGTPVTRLRWVAALAFEGVKAVYAGDLLSKPPRRNHTVQTAQVLPTIPPSPRRIRGAGDASHTPTFGSRDMDVKGIYL